MRGPGDPLDIGLVEGSFRPTRDGKCAVAGGGMVSTAFPDATRAGASMLRRGGNAVDAACAAALALCVCEPQASGLGGQSLALVHVDGRTVAVDGSSRAPSLACTRAFRGPAAAAGRLVGYAASTVPSTVAAIGHLSERYGRLEWADVVAPAARIARRGYRITPLQSRLQADSAEAFMAVPSRSGARYFMRDGEAPHVPGDLFVQDDLARTLEDIASGGYRSFYTGETAERIGEDMRRNGGLVRADDLRMVPVPAERRPASGRHGRGLRIAAMPMPAAGGAVLFALAVMRRLRRPLLHPAPPESHLYAAGAVRAALARREDALAGWEGGAGAGGDGDGGDCDAGRRERLAGEAARAIRAGAGRGGRPAAAAKAAAAESPAADDGSGETTHLSAMDKEGNAVGITQSIELVYGSKAAASGLGFLYNNYMSAYETADASHRHYLRPNTAPRTCAAPCIVFRGARPWIVAGSPGSSRIVSAVSLFLSRVVDGGADMGSAVRMPRIHCSPDGAVSIEDDGGGPRGATAAAAERLRRAGYAVDVREGRSFYMGAIHAVMRRQAGEGFQGVAEVRRDGTAGGTG